MAASLITNVKSEQSPPHTPGISDGCGAGSQLLTLEVEHGAPEGTRHCPGFMVVALHFSSSDGCKDQRDRDHAAVLGLELLLTFRQCIIQGSPRKQKSLQLF